MPWPSVNQRRGGPKGQPTASLSLLVHVGGMPGWPGASVCGLAASGIGSARLPLDAENRRRIRLRIEANALTGAAPVMLRAAQELRHLEGLALANLQGGERQLDHRFARVEGIEIDGNEDAVGAIRADLAVEEHALVLGRIEAKIGELVQRRIVAADVIDRGDIGFDVARPIPVPDFIFVLLGMEIFLASGNGAVLAQLEAVIDAVGGRERRRED